MIDIRGGHSLEYKQASKKARDKVTNQINNMTKFGKRKPYIGRVVFTSSNLHEPSMGIDEFKHGLFTYYLLQCLKRKSFQPEIHIEELILLTKEKVLSYSIKHQLNQTPVAYTNIQAEFFIPTYKTANNDEAVLEVLGSTKKNELSEDYRPYDISLPKADLDRLEDSRKIPPSKTPIELKKTRGQIFISYSHRDKEFVNRLASDLESAGMNVWLDEKEIKVGDSISQKIEGGISGCDFFCLVISGHSVNSKWVEREYRTALNMQLSPGTNPKILPLLIEGVELPLLLKDIKYADFSRSYKKGYNDLLNAIKKQ